MTTKTRTPNTQAHTKAMLESILRPHSLEELWVMNDRRFPFKAVKVYQAGPLPPKTIEVIGVGEVIELIRRGPQRTFITTNHHPDTSHYVVSDCKVWRLADSED